MNRRRKDVRSIRRRTPFRAPRRSILIVCEGEKTEPNYIAHYKKLLGLCNVNLEICGKECGTDPLSVVEYGEGRFRRDLSVDDCFCIIDRDAHDHTRLLAAQQKSLSLNNIHRGRRFELYVSDPCIEYWFILHSNYTRAPFVREGKNSRGEVALERLKAFWPTYEKGQTETGQFLEERFDFAFENAERALNDAKETGENNPSTSVHLLINELRNLAKA